MANPRIVSSRPRTFVTFWSYASLRVCGSSDAADPKYGRVSMHLDIVTLMAAGSFVAALSGVLLTGAWTQMRGQPALLWWAAAKYTYAIGIGFLALGTAGGTATSLAIGGFLTSVCPAILWAGTRIFVHRPVSVLFLIAGVVVWLAVAAVPFAHGPQVATTIIGFAIWIAFLLAADWELWLSRGEPLKGRWPLMALLSLHALIFLGGIYDTIFHQMLALVAPPLNSWFGLIHFEALTYAIGSAIFMVVMCQERTALVYIKVAETDALTGAASRGAFFGGAERLLERCRADGTPLSVIEFDLDDFKAVNDAHGHAVGDHVLRIFAETIRAVLRPNDFFGRHGGEEFAVVLPGVTIETACVIADRARRAFAVASRDVDGVPVYATVSAGVSGAQLADSFAAALEAADHALYRAKNRGRNRVERADKGLPAEPEPTVIRVA